MEILLLTDKNNFFGQTRKPWVSIDTQKFISNLSSYGINCRLSTFPLVATGMEIPSNEIIFYHFSQKWNLRQYLKNVADILNQLNNKLIPSIDLLRSHENKGYQELLKKVRNVNSPKGYYISCVDDVLSIDLQFPLVVKTIDGSNGKGVFLCNNIQEIYKSLKEYRGIKLNEKLDLLRRRYFRRKKNYPEYPDYDNYKDYIEYKEYIKRDIRFVVQEFIPGQKFDYRVLAIYDRYYVIKRHNREGDFRASGAKKFDIDFEIDENLLYSAEQFKNAFPDTPYLSMGIIFDNRDKTYKLLEFQALHFGINVIVKNDGYFIKKNGCWVKVYKRNAFEDELAYGLAKFLGAS